MLFRTPLVLLAGALAAAVAAHATTFCVHDEAAFRTALATAASNGQDDAIHLARGTYHTNGQAFDYEPAETNSLSIAGGFDGDCSSRRLNPALTVLDGDGSSRVFVSGTRLGSVATATSPCRTASRTTTVRACISRIRSTTATAT